MMGRQSRRRQKRTHTHSLAGLLCGVPVRGEALLSDGLGATHLSTPTALREHLAQTHTHSKDTDLSRCS